MHPKSILLLLSALEITRTDNPAHFEPTTYEVSNLGSRILGYNKLLWGVRSQLEQELKEKRSATYCERNVCNTHAFEGSSRWRLHAESSNKLTNKQLKNLLKEIKQSGYQPSLVTYINLGIDEDAKLTGRQLLTAYFIDEINIIETGLRENVLAEPARLQAIIERLSKMPSAVSELIAPGFRDTLNKHLEKYSSAKKMQSDMWKHERRQSQRKPNREPKTVQRHFGR
jgi:hypothetical protein